MRRMIGCAFLVTALACSSSLAGDPPEAGGDDVILRALVDELGRSMEQLQLEDLERPYFIEYSAADADVVRVVAQLGALSTDETQRVRRLVRQVRVGSYELDNTNFGGDANVFGGMFGGGADWTDLPIEDDYAAIRQAIWWATDSQYKQVVEDLAAKQAYMKNKTIEDRPNDFSGEEPVQHVEQGIEVRFDADPVRQMAEEISRVFLEYPKLRRSSVQLIAGCGNKYLVNSEGSRLREASEELLLEVVAEAQAEDGMILRDKISVYARGIDQLPPVDELKKRCEELAQALIAAAQAPTMESYSGPVLVDARAAAQVVASVLAPNLAGGQKPLGEDANVAMLGMLSGRQDLSKKLGKRVLPKFMTVIDDPTQEQIAGVPVLGSYRHDDQAVPAAPLTLVEEGVLKTLVMSRNPSKEISKSNGHGRRAMMGAGEVTAATGCLILRSDDPLDEDELKVRLIEACEEEDLEFGLRISGVGALPGMEDPMARLSMFRRLRPGRGPTVEPVLFYKVYVEDGREELVRGMEITSLDMKALRRMLAAGEQAYVHNYIGAGLMAAGSAGSTVVCPALLFEELDLSKPEAEYDKPPILPNPLARQEG